MMKCVKNFTNFIGTAMCIDVGNLRIEITVADTYAAFKK